MKRLLIASALIAGFGATAMAAEPKSAEECLQQALDIAKSAEDKKLGDDKLAKVEEIVSRMEGECEAGKFADAVKTGDEAKAAIGK